jgi:hypothetical protein
MSYIINPVAEDRCVFLSYEGETPVVEFSTARSEANGVLDERHWNRLLVDVSRLQSAPNARELFDLAEGLSSSVSRPTRVALVVRPDQEPHARLLQKAARTRRVFLAYFLALERAVSWMRQTALGRQAIDRKGKEKP